MKPLPARLVFTLVLTVIALTAALARTTHAQNGDPAATPLRPGDRLVVKLWTDTSLADTLQIDQQVRVILPQLGALPLAGVPASNIADSVRSAYSRIFRPVAVDITPLRRVTVVGEVLKPNVYYLDMSSTVREAIALAGGITDIGINDPVFLIRDDSTYSVRDWDVRSDPFVVLQSDDIVAVHRESWLKRNIFSVISGVGIVASLMITIFHK